MFSGIIEGLGSVEAISLRGAIYRFGIQSKDVCLDARIGDSISVNGACLTVVGNDRGLLNFEVIPETFKNTNLGYLRSKEKVNLERALRAGDRISGHFVTGHVDCVGDIRKKSYINGNLTFEIAIPSKFISWILPKGSIAVDGISLTIAGRKSNTFLVYIIPHTLKNTTLDFKGPSDKVNIEFDILAKRA